MPSHGPKSNPHKLVRAKKVMIPKKRRKVSKKVTVIRENN